MFRKQGVAKSHRGSCFFTLPCYTATLLVCRLTGPQILRQGSGQSDSVIAHKTVGLAKEATQARTRVAWHSDMLSRTSKHIVIANSADLESGAFFRPS